MQNFNFGMRGSATPSMDESHSRNVPSSIYSGPGPAEELALPSQQQQSYYGNGDHQRRPSQQASYLPYHQPPDTRPNQLRASTMLNMNDPVAMHLLMETAIMDSKDFEILSFEELDGLKKERNFLRSKVEGAKRQFGLEKKMYEASLLMNKLSPNDANTDRQKRTSFLRRKSSSALSVAEEPNTANEKVEQLAQEVQILEARLQEVDKRIMHHTAGVLQFTHRGLKKNVRKNELPRSPESMNSQARSISRSDGASDFDERSLYQVPDYVHEYASRASRRVTKDVQPIEDVAIRLYTVNTQLYQMIQEVALTEYFEPPPEPTDERLQGRVGAQIQAHLTYLGQGLEALGTGKEAASRAVPEESIEQVTELATKLHGMLERTNSVSKTPVPAQEMEHGSDLQSQLEYSATVLDRLNQRVDALLEQKDILTRQIQQQRELNSKSDAQLHARITDLTEELEEAKKLQEMSDKEAHQAQSQLSLLMEQFDNAKQNEQLLEKQLNAQGGKESQALETERSARKEIEAKLMREIETKHNALTELQAEHVKLQNDFKQRHEEMEGVKREMGDVKMQANSQTKQKQDELETLRKEMAEMESQVVQFQTELTMARAELDSAYGSRAQRAADISLNPDVKKQIDELQARNSELQQELEELSAAHETKGLGSAELQNKVNSLQKELKDTIEDYEVMTKASIDAEKERDHLEATVDEMRDKCETLEAQINEDQVKWLGVKNTLPPETTSTMVLKNEFKKMMRDSRAESMKNLKAEQEERRRLEGIIRGLKKESDVNTPSKATSAKGAAVNSAAPAPTRATASAAAPSTPSKD